MYISGLPYFNRSKDACQRGVPVYTYMCVYMFIYIYESQAETRRVASGEEGGYLDRSKEACERGTAVFMYMFVYVHIYIYIYLYIYICVCINEAGARRVASCEASGYPNRGEDACKEVRRCIHIYVCKCLYI